MIRTIFALLLLLPTAIVAAPSPPGDEDADSATVVEEGTAEPEAAPRETLTLESEAAAAELVKRAMEEMARGEAAAAVALLEPYMIIPEADIAKLKEQLEALIPAARERFGAPLGVEPLAQEQVGTSLLLIAYLQTFEKHIVRWRFFFYKPHDGWVLSTLKQDTNMEALFTSGGL